MAEYLATSLAMENVVNAPRVISSCLPISTTSISLVGSLSRSIMLPASRAACRHQGIRRGLAVADALQVEAGVAGLRGEGHDPGIARQLRCRGGVAFPCEGQDRAPLRRLVAERGEHRGLGQLTLGDPGGR